MTTPVEALSISSITSLLANPPHYPRNPTHQRHDSLVLYIVRVPGSKDVFLTPLKPPTKVSISLEAIRSCLYYLHVETPEDDVLRKSLEIEQKAEEERSPKQPVLRKPLPPTPFANYPASQRPATPPKSYPHYQPTGQGINGGTQAERYTARGSHIRFTSPNGVSVQRKPLGARPLPSQQISNENTPFSALLSSDPAETAETGDGLRRKSVPDRKPAPWTPRLEVPGNPLIAPASTTFEAQKAESPVQGRQESIPAGLTNITLIRRDPTSGTQWNVGSIKVESRQHSLGLLQPVEITLTAPGYSKFSRPALREDNSPSSPSSTSPGKDMFFKRRLGFRPLPDQHRSSLQHVRANSGDFLSEVTNTPAKKVRQVYSFTSPWQGMCTFSNGMNGKSLKCRHSLPTTSSAQGDTSAGVAELRFNLPWSVLRPRDGNRQGAAEADKLPISQLLGKSPTEQWRRSMQTLKPRRWQSRPHASTITEGQPIPVVQQRGPIPLEQGSDDEDRLSLKLGREKAGGGFKGHSAKLGKLILEDEGLKMCDLVVGACMGVWWQHYLESNTI